MLPSFTCATCFCPTLLLPCMWCVSSQARKLQEMFKAMQHEKEELRRQNEELKRQMGIRGGGAGGVAGRSGVAPRPSGHGSGRQVSPFQGGPTQMVRLGIQAAACTCRQLWNSVNEASCRTLHPVHAWRLYWDCYTARAAGMTSEPARSKHLLAAAQQNGG